MNNEDCLQTFRPDMSLEETIKATQWSKIGRSYMFVYVSVVRIVFLDLILKRHFVSETNQSVWVYRDFQKDKGNHNNHFMLMRLCTLVDFSFDWLSGMPSSDYNWYHFLFIYWSSSNDRFVIHLGNKWSNLSWCPSNVIRIFLENGIYKHETTVSLKKT